MLCGTLRRTVRLTAPVFLPRRGQRTSLMAGASSRGETSQDPRPRAHDGRAERQAALPGYRLREHEYLHDRARDDGGVALGGACRRHSLLSGRTAGRADRRVRGALRVPALDHRPGGSAGGPGGGRGDRGQPQRVARAHGAAVPGARQADPGGDPDRDELRGGRAGGGRSGAPRAHSGSGPSDALSQGTRAAA